MSYEYTFTFRGLPYSATVHIHLADELAAGRHAEIIDKLDQLADVVGDKEKLRAFEQEINAKREQWEKAIEPVKPE